MTRRDVAADHAVTVFPKRRPAAFGRALDRDGAPVLLLLPSRKGADMPGSIDRRRGSRGRDRSGRRGLDRGRSRGRGRDRDQDDDDRERGRPARGSSGSPAPYIAAGVFATVGLVVLGLVLSGDNKPPVGTQPAQGQPAVAGGAPQAGATSQTPVRRSSGTEMATRVRQGSSAAVRLDFVDKGFSRTGEDLRYYRATCGNCNAEITTLSETCPGCGAKLRWPQGNKISCSFCCKNLRVQGVAEGSKWGLCAYCGGTGEDPNFTSGVDRMPFGMSRSGSRASGGGACPACKGSGRCRKCEGDHTYALPQILGSPTDEKTLDIQF